MPDLKLTREQRRLLRRAFESSYSGPEEIEMLVSFELDKKLGLAKGLNLELAAAEVIEWAKQAGRTRELSDALCRDRPGNPDVLAYRASLAAPVPRGGGQNDGPVTIQVLLDRSGLAGRLKVDQATLDSAWEPGGKDPEAAWEMHVELTTRIATVPLHDGEGAEKAALDSVAALFGITREILRRYGPTCRQFSKIAVPVLNQVVRPFTAKWHVLPLDDRRAEFRHDLEAMQRDLASFARLLADVTNESLHS
jgi:hypothetical protein